MTQHAKHASPQLDLFHLSWPLFVEMALFMAIGTLGLWMAGQVSAASVAVFGMANQLRMVFDRIFRVVSMGASVVVTQQRGAGDEAGAQALARAGFSASAWLGLIAAALVGAWPEPLLRLLQLPAELLPMAVPFMRVIAVAMALEAINVTMFAVLRAFTFTRVTMRLVLAMNILHVVVSAPLVFGLGPMPALGVMGLAWGQLASRLLVFSLLVWVWRHDLRVKLRLRDAIRVAREPFAAILAIGLPSAGEKIGYRVCYMATVAMAGSLGTAALAVHAYAAQINGIVNMVMNAVASGTEIIIGHKIGAGELRGANALMRRSVRICLLATGLGGIAAWLLAPQAIALFSDNPAVPALLTSILAIEIFAGQGRSLNVLVTGGLRAAGDARFPAKVNIYINVLAGTMLAWLLGIHFGLGLVGIWLAYMADECLRGFGMLARWRWRGWAPLARVARRRALQRQHAAATI
ncbi:MATE family efflux transporter [Uliginosibacterium sp. 31-16]|uniref:MATE family efflux transporter n=1 Tax=Uliginosibacterium sp. 31-16 TaxID=3068315 RepID=UPI00273ECC1E|nr:MATE family efflux transporter [Uliginosibacterium sp. 31-16]MDP5241095.1 MATE family efflux transporter [Uliginosibacterium sp. 31-16]